MRPVLGLAFLVVAVLYLRELVSGHDLRGPLGDIAGSVARNPAGLLLGLVAYAAAFWLRAWSWRRVLPALTLGQSWAALHVSLLGNHVLPLRLGEALRPASVVRRTSLPLGPVAASTVTMRAADLLAVLLLAMLIAPALLSRLASGGQLTVLVVLLVAAFGCALLWSRRHRSAVRMPGFLVATSAVLAWALEASVVWAVARAADVALSPYEAVGVTAVTIAAQVVALTPGGFGTYEAAATAALVAVGADPAAAFAVALTTHAVKTTYALAVGTVALFVPAPSFWGRFRLSRVERERPPQLHVDAEAPLVVFIPAHDEEATVGDVVRRLPPSCEGRPVVVLVIDDGSSDATATIAAAAGARVISQPQNLGLGAAVRRGLAEASAFSPIAVIYLDADGEYFPEDLPALAQPVLAGTADYVVGSRFSGEIRTMLTTRRAGNKVLTRWLRWMARRSDITDGQSGFRAFSPAAAADAEIVHDYNYAQVLTLDLLAKGYRYAEVPITYSFRESGTSFVRLGRYLRRVVPAVHRELNTAAAPQSSTTWLANRARAAAQAVSSKEPSLPSAATAS